MRKKKITKKFTRGVPKRYRHIWRYGGVWDETKVKPNLWRFTYTATKGRKHKGMGSFGVGTTGAWKISGTQYIKKISKNEYQTKLVGTKKPLKFNVKTPKKFR